MSGLRNPPETNETNETNIRQTTIEPQTQTLTDIFFDWLDKAEAIEAIPSGSSPGPDGIPVKMLKSAKVPISRMLCLLFHQVVRSS